jgi:valyl-tRNA synthetase
VTAPAAQVPLVEAARPDLVDAGRITTLVVEPGAGPLRVAVELADPTPAT